MAPNRRGGYKPRPTRRIETWLRAHPHIVRKGARSAYLDSNEAHQQIARFLDDVYIHERIHSSLGHLTPAAHGARWQEEHARVLDLELTGA